MYVIGERGSVDYLNTATGGRWRGLCASPCPLVAHGIHDSVDDSLEGGFLVPCQEGGDLWVWGWWGVTGCMYEGGRCVLGYDPQHLGAGTDVADKRFEVSGG